MVRIIVSILLGASIAFGLFVVMAKLIENDGKAMGALPPPPVIDIVMQKPDDELQTRVRKPPPPPPPPQEPPKIELVEPDQADPNASGFSLSIPSVDTGGITTSVGGIGAMRDGDASPIVRIPPDYPPQAARDGKEGWVRLSFTINELGGVEDVDVIDADPKRIFDRNAKRALRKWKYRPKIVDGVAQKQFGLEVQLDFKLGE
ncbi:energy transducer TonB [Brumicola pallidula]|uniref:Protein TonB n=1 Tax=Brumicola pallidula DSM 14239 = ACAM 615 TaxID=1121922 RepID=K6ZZ29_9ALTE|nr:energy transducer TonB [Glaciecola pallidula]GAC28545.1 periplasmic protein TonB [Glaciecola pallidula DSM 14239 = ACAM 615]